MKVESWQERAAAKRASILAEIPAAWRLDKTDLERAEKQRVLAGPFIEQLLGADTLSIVGKDSVPLVDAIKNGTYTSEQVTEAFCKSAAIIHQIVSIVPPSAPREVQHPKSNLSDVEPLLAGVLPGAGDGAGEGTRQVPRRAWSSDGTPARVACQPQGPVPRQGCRHDHGLCWVDWR